MSRSRHFAGESGIVTGTIYDSANVAVLTNRLLTLRLTVRNARTGVNIVDNVDCLTAPGNLRVVYDGGTGAFKLVIAPDLTDVADIPEGQEIKVAEITWTNTKDGRTETGRERHEIICSKLTRLALCTLDDVEEHLGKIADKDIPKVATQIDDVTASLERYCGRWFAYRENETELFSPRGNMITLYVNRWPIVSIPPDGLKESYNSDFAAPHAMVVSPQDYVAFKDFGAVRLRYWRLSLGEQTAQLTYSGGMARETAGLPWDLREAAAQQAAYQYQRRTALGTSSQTAGDGGGSVIFMEKDLLPSVKRRCDQFRRPLIT